MPKRPPVPHHSAPCLHPTRDGAPCPNRAVTHHPEHGPMCAMHAHRSETSEGRTATILVRLTPEEKQAVELVSGTLDTSLSDLARTMLLGLPMPEPPRPRIDAQAYAQLGKIGGNLNQIARALNTVLVAGEGQAEVETRNLLDHIKELRQTLNEVRLGLAGAP